MKERLSHPFRQSETHGVRRALVQRARLLVLIVFLHAIIATRALSETFFTSRYQYYQEESGRIRVDSNYSLFAVDLNDTLAVDGSFLYSAISGASPSGLPPLVKGTPVPVVALTDERFAFSLGATKQLANHTLRAGFAYSDESDYNSSAYSLQDTISLNQKNTELVFGFAYTDDIVGENGAPLRASKSSIDTVIGINQILGPNDLLSLTATLGWKNGYLSDPYKRVLLDDFFVLPDHRPDHRFEQLAFAQWTHYVVPLGVSVETSYRYGHNDYGSHSHTVELALYRKFFHDHLILRPGFRYYRQTAARFYDLSFTGNPQYYSADYRLSAEETVSLSLEARWFILKDKFSFDVGYERYTTRGIDGKTPQSSYPDANSVSVGLHYQF